MKGLQFEFEWENPQGVITRELRATWSHLTIRVDGIPVTQIHDYAAKSVRDGIYLPLYPLAEWLAMNWWPLFHELETPSRKTFGDYGRRHNLRFAREGFALPDLIFKPLNGKIALSWMPTALQGCDVRFLQSGLAVLDTDTVKADVSALIQHVLRRLEIEGLGETLLHQEWIALQADDPEERSFCMAAGSLGLDPYNLSDRLNAEIPRIAEMLPQDITPDFFAAADAEELLPQAERLQSGLVEISLQTKVLKPLQDLQRKVPNIGPLRTPWEEGYGFAQQLRKMLGLKDRTARSLSEVSEFLGLDPQSLGQAVITTLASTQRKGKTPRFYDALLALNAKGSPGFMIEKPLETSRMFAFCRALFEYLTAEPGPPVLISPAISERQKRNRAFAAEFLAPADLLRAAIPGDVLDANDLDELAGQFGVSPNVIEHQVENQKLARVVST